MEKPSYYHEMKNLDLVTTEEIIQELGRRNFAFILATIDNAGMLKSTFQGPSNILLQVMGDLSVAIITGNIKSHEEELGN